MNNLIGISGKKGHGKDTVASMIRYLQQSKRIEEEPTYAYYVDFTRVDDLQYEDDYEIRRFADKLKDTVCSWTGCTREQLEDREFKEQPLPCEWWYWAYTRENHNPKFNISYIGSNEEEMDADPTRVLVKLNRRMVMQRVGTEGGRIAIHPDIWVNSLFANYKPTPRVPFEVKWNDVIKFKEGDVFEDVHGEKYIAELPNWIIPDTRFPNEAEAIKRRNGLVIRVYNPSVESTDQHASETALDDYKGFDHLIVNDGSLEDLFERVRKIYNKYN